uniref:Nad2 protein n=1 Tax=Dunaliella viridis TaxID=140095 RepID=A0A0C5C0P3_9CHLO|nr:NADH dehydrogenase subunit 2 [Dunaliella viridis]AJN90456.1 NADH dehydrogenase subunit 2 [Dunaliella viridis]
MLWYSLIELDFLISLIIVIVYGLFSLRCKNIHIADVIYVSRILPFLFILGYYIDSCNTVYYPTIDMLVAILTSVVMGSFRNFEAILLLLLAFVGNIFMLHSIDFMTFFITLEAQNFCFFVLCALIASKVSSSFNVEASIKFFTLSAFTSGILLYWFSHIYLVTGCTTFSLINNFLYTNSMGGIEGIGGSTAYFSYFILCALLFKLGTAPLHLWVTHLYSGIKRNLLLYVSTIPKLSLFGFWYNNFQASVSYASVLLFAVFSLVLGSFSAYNQPALRTLFAYSTINEMGLMLLAVESAGYNALFQHLGLYIVSQFLLWNLHDKSLFAIVAITLAGLPPLAGFFGKAFIFWHASTVGLYTTLLVALVCTVVSLVYYLRIVRLFVNPYSRFLNHGLSCSIKRGMYTSNGNIHMLHTMETRVALTSLCVLLLFFLPIFVIKPFVCFA